MDSNVQTPILLTQLNEFDKRSLLYLANRTQCSKYISKQNPEYANEVAEFKSKIKRHDRYIQSKLRKLRDSPEPDLNMDIQRHYDALMNILVKDIEMRLSNIKNQVEDSLFASVDDPEDAYIRDVYIEPNY
jgi:hypothetical protein